MSAKPWMRWTWAVALATGAAAAWSVLPGFAQQPGTPAPAPATPVADPATPIDVAQAVNETYNLDTGKLSNGPSPADREEAARRLMARQSSRADQVILSTIQATLQQNNLAVLQAVAHVLPEDPTPDPQLIPLITRNLLPSKNEAAVQDAARALAWYRGQPAAMRAVINFVTGTNAPAPEAPHLRAAAARGLGISADRDAAAALVAVTDPKQPAVVRAAAADALVAMTGLRANGQDPARWQRWWRDNLNKPPEQFEADLLDRLRRPAPQAADLKPFLKGLYDTARPEARADFLVQSLAAPDPATRGAAVLFAAEVFDNTGQLAGTVKERLREMIRDGSPEVRQSVAQTLFHVNDQKALAPLLAQLEQEPDPSARGDQIKAIAQIGDIRAVQPLLARLDDPVPAVAAAAATALGARDLVPVINRNPATKDAVRRTLQNRVEQRGPSGQPQPTPEMLRAACVEALGQLGAQSGDRDLEKFFLDLLDRQPPAVRRAALVSLGAMGNPQTKDAILHSLTDPDPDVRLAAVNALGSVGRFADVGIVLFGMFGPGGRMEQDPLVQDAAWNTFKKLLPTADEHVLIDWQTGKLKDLPKYKVVILQALEDKQEKAGKLQDLASTRESIGFELMKTDPPQPEKAADYFGKALDYWRGTNAGQNTLSALAQEREGALLAARRYADAVKFAREMIARDPGFQQALGAQFLKETERLLSPGNYGHARDLAVEALKPPNEWLLPRFRLQINERRESAEQMLRTAPPRTPR